MLEISWNLKCVLEISWNLVDAPGDCGEFYNYQISLCVLLMLFSVHHLIRWLDGTVMSVGRSSSSHAHLQTFHNSCRTLCI